MSAGAEPVALSGDARGRGLAQAAAEPGAVAAVRRAVGLRLHEGARVLASAPARRYLRELRDYTARAAPQALAEVDGLATGFGLDADGLFAYLHLAIVLDMAQVRAATTDGCSAWAALAPDGSAWLGKNRDFRGEHQLIQRLFLQQDPLWGDRRVLCVGSLGAPGAYSSGINSDGLALVDTQITTGDHGVGLCRYFLMNEVLARCADVPEAIDLMGALRHAGGGSLVLGDALGNRAAVELGHSGIAVQRPDGDEPVSRTNHFTSAALRAATLARPGEPMIGSSPARLATLHAALAALPRPDMAQWARATMATHDTARRSGLCRHGQDGDATTISTAVFATAERTLYFCDGNPCRGTWRRHTL